jgi:PAS domain S-box-containing protein
MTSSVDKTFDFSKSDFLYRSILETAPIGILIFNNEFLVKFVNNNFFHFSGVINGKPSDILGKSIYEYRLFEGADLRKDLNELREGSVFEKVLDTARTISGIKISIIVKCVPILSEGKFNGGIIIVEDVKISPAKEETAFIHSQNFQNFLLLVSDCYFFTDKEGTIRLCSSKGYDDFSFLFEPEITKGIKRPQKLSGILFKKILETVVSSNKTIWTELPYIKNNSEHKANLTLIPLIEEGSEAEFIIVLVKDVSKETDLVTINDQEIKELRKYQQITAKVLDGLIGFDNDGRIFFWNESSVKLFGLTRSEVYGKFIGKIFQQIDLPFLENMIAELKKNRLWEGELKIGEDESIADFYKVKVAVIEDESEENYYMLCSNVTQKVKAEKELRQSEEKFRNIVINSHEYICILDLNGKITYANPNFLESFEYTIEELTGINFGELVETSYLNQNQFDVQELISYRSQSIELPMINKKNQRIYVLASFSAAYDSNNVIQYYSVILTDITLKKESEKDLLLIRSVFEASHDGIALISSRKFVLVNDSFVQMFGFRSASEIIGQDPLDFVDKDDIQKVNKYIISAEENRDYPARFGFKGKKKNASIIELENSVSFYETNGEKFIVWVLRDISEEKKSQEALQISEERYRSISENIKESFYTEEFVEGKLHAVFYTPAIKQITGYSAEEFLGEEEKWQRIIYPDDVENTINRIRNLYNDSSRNFEVFEYRIIDALGNIIWIENKVTVKRNSKGEIQKVFGVVIDNTISKRAEEELKKSALELKELNEAKDRFISIISHDLRTPFSSILGFTDFLLSNSPDLTNEKREQYVRLIQESAKSMLGLVNSLLDYTRLQTGKIKFEPVRINAKEVVERSLQILSGAALQKKIELTSGINKDFYIHADEGLLLQVINNLVSNAIKFTNPEGKINVIASVDIEKRHVQFTIEDNGVGMNKEDISKLFKVDAKFTTPGTAGEKGTGLGLSLVADIVRKHGGNIWVESQEGKGSRFYFTIPIASTNILLVDDIKTDRLLYSKLIKNLIPQYNIIEAENGKAALELIKQSSPVLVITDHKMPVMTGYELVKQLNITDLRYKPPVIILSSDVNDTIKSEYRALGVEYIFQKPVNLSEFKNAIQMALRKAVFS